MDIHQDPPPPAREASNQAGLPRRRVLRDEVLLVLALSLAASALYAIVDILSAPIRGVEAPLFADVGLVYQLLNLTPGVESSEGGNAFGYTEQRTMINGDTRSAS